MVQLFGRNEHCFTTTNTLEYVQIENPDLLPRSIKDVVGKTFKFGITIEKENVAYGVEYYKVLKVWYVDNLISFGDMSDTTSAKETTLTLGAAVFRNSYIT